MPWSQQISPTLHTHPLWWYREGRRIFKLYTVWGVNHFMLIQETQNGECHGFYMHSNAKICASQTIQWKHTGKTRLGSAAHVKHTILNRSLSKNRINFGADFHPNEDLSLASQWKAQPICFSQLFSKARQAVNVKIDSSFYEQILCLLLLNPSKICWCS